MSRVGITNHRTRFDNLDLLVREVACIGASLASGGEGQAPG